MIVEQFKIVYFEPFNSVFSVVISSNDSFYQVGPLLFRYFRLTNDETKPTLNWIVVVVAVNFHRIIRVIYSYALPRWLFTISATTTTNLLNRLKFRISVFLFRSGFETLTKKKKKTLRDSSITARFRNLKKNPFISNTFPLKLHDSLLVFYDFFHSNMYLFEWTEPTEWKSNETRWGASDYIERMFRLKRKVLRSHTKKPLSLAWERNTWI